MIAVFLGRKFGAWIFRDEGSEDGLLALEFAGLVFGVHPIEDIFLVLMQETMVSDMLES